MKRKILGVCLTIALLTTLGLVTALPTGATSTYIGYTLGKVSADAATWSTDNTAPSGSYSAKLTHTADAGEHAWVQFIPPTGISLAEFVAAPTTYGFTYWRTEDKIGPLLEMRFTDGGDALAEITVDMALYDYTTDDLTDEWIVKTASGTEQCMYYGEDSADVGLSGTGALGDLSDLITDIAAGAAADDAAAVGAWEMTRVRVDLGWSADTQDSAWVDDVKIAGTTYDLEPIDLDLEYYKTDDTVDVTLCNNNSTTNADAMAIDTVDITVVSTTDTTGDTVALTETGSDTGVFTGSITLVGTAPANRTNDEIVVSDTDTVTVTLTSSDWGAGTQDIVLTATVDDSAPVIVIVSPAADSSTTDTTPYIEVSYSDVGSDIDTTSVVMTVGGTDVTTSATVTGSSANYTAPTALTDGSYTVTVDVSDIVGNAATQASWSFNVDTVDPVISGQVATPAVVTPSVSSNITFTATVADATSGIDTVTIDLSDAAIGGAADEPMLDGGVDPDVTADDDIYTAEITATIATEATYLLAVTATDEATNSVSANITLVVSSDTTAPVISSPAITYLYGLSSAPPGGVGGTVTVSANVTEAVLMGTVTATCTAFTGTATLLDGGSAPDATAGDDIYTGTATVATGTSGNYTVTIAAVDDKGNVATPDATLTLTVAPDTGWDIDLVEGWNLISLPVIPTDGSIDVVLAAISDNVTQVRTWVYVSGVLTEKIWAEGGAVGDLDEMTDGCGYWIEMTEEITLTVTGVVLPAAPQAPPSYSVYEGWNFIGFKSLSADSAADYLGTAVTLVFETMYGYDAAGDVYTVITTGTDLEPGQGYWLAVSADGTIYP